MAEIVEIFQSYGIDAGGSAPVVEALKTRPKAWVDFMMRFELGLEEPNPRRALQSALTIAGAYIAGGLIPLAPYMLESNVASALPASIAITIVWHWRSSASSRAASRARTRSGARSRPP